MYNNSAISPSKNLYYIGNVVLIMLSGLVGILTRQLVTLGSMQASYVQTITIVSVTWIVSTVHERMCVIIPACLDSLLN